MPDDVHKITIEVPRPRGGDPGAVEEGYYCVADQHVVETDANGRPISGAPKHYLDPGRRCAICLCIASAAAARPHVGIEIVQSAAQLWTRLARSLIPRRMNRRSAHPPHHLARLAGACLPLGGRLAFSPSGAFHVLCCSTRQLAQ